MIILFFIHIKNLKIKKYFGAIRKTTIHSSTTTTEQPNKRSTDHQPNPLTFIGSAKANHINIHLPTPPTYSTYLLHLPTPPTYSTYLLHLPTPPTYSTYTNHAHLHHLPHRPHRPHRPHHTNHANPSLASFCKKGR